MKMLLCVDDFFFASQSRKSIEYLNKVVLWKFSHARRRVPGR